MSGPAVGSNFWRGLRFGLLISLPMWLFILIGLYNLLFRGSH